MIGGLTLLSRILGMFRDIVSAESFGTSWQWDAFLYAFMLPNFLRRLVGEGTLSSAFIPVYTSLLQTKGKKEAFRFANTILTILVAGLTGFLFAAEAVLALLLRMPDLPPVLHLTCRLLVPLFPYLFFISLTALAMGILNCHHHFFSPSLSPVILDLVWIAAVLWIVPLGTNSESRVGLLALCILFSGAIQLGVQIPYLRRFGFNPRFLWDFSHPALKQVGKLVLPTILGFAIVQINLLVDMTLGFWVGPGANSSLWYGNRLMQFPLGVFAIAMGTALLPAISHHTARKEMNEVKKAVSLSLRSVFFIILPSTLGLILLRTPIVRLLFERGEFDAVSTARTAAVVLWYTAGLFAFSGQKIIVSGFYSLQDTKTPMKVGALSLVINLAFNLFLMRFMKEAGLALATSIAGTANFLLLIYFYQKKISGFPVKEIVVSSLRILAASIGMGLLAAGLQSWLYETFPLKTTLRLFVSVMGSIAAAVPAYALFCGLLKVPEIRGLWNWIKNRTTPPFISPIDSPTDEEPL